jgi:hypothetical protein
VGAGGVLGWGRAGVDTIIIIIIAIIIIIRNYKTQDENATFEPNEELQEMYANRRRIRDIWKNVLGVRYKAAHKKHQVFFFWRLVQVVLARVLRVCCVFVACLLRVCCVFVACLLRVCCAFVACL